MPPEVSIITATYNSRETVEACLHSVARQNHIGLEHIVVDGGSTDGTTDRLRQWNDERLRWTSEPDRGIYDALNKGIDRARGEWLYFLGADDTLEPDVLAAIRTNLKQPFVMLYGDVLFSNNHRMRSFLGPRTLLQNTVQHQSAFYHRSLFENFRYDTSLRILADYELNLRLYLSRQPTLYLNRLIARCAVGGASSQLSLSLRETNLVRSRYVRRFWQQMAFSGLLGLYYSQKRLRNWLYGHQV